MFDCVENCQKWIIDCQCGTSSSDLGQLKVAEQKEKDSKNNCVCSGFIGFIFVGALAFVIEVWTCFCLLPFACRCG